jgi:hypothetical protein
MGRTVRFRETLRRLVLLAIGRWPGSAASSPPLPEVATALGYDIAAALEEPDRPLPS